MGIGIPKNILGLKGQRVNEIKLDKQQLVIHCHRDKRRRPRRPRYRQKVKEAEK